MYKIQYPKALEISIVRIKHIFVSLMWIFLALNRGLMSLELYCKINQVVICYMINVGMRIISEV